MTSLIGFHAGFSKLFCHVEHSSAACTNAASLENLEEHFLLQKFKKGLISISPNFLIAMLLSSVNKSGRFYNQRKKTTYFIFTSNINNKKLLPIMQGIFVCGPQGFPWEFTFTRNLKGIKTNTFKFHSPCVLGN